MTSVIIAMETSRLNLQHPDFLPNVTEGGIAGISRAVEDDLYNRSNRRENRAADTALGAAPGLSSILLEGNVLKSKGRIYIVSEVVEHLRRNPRNGF